MDTTAIKHYLPAVRGFLDYAREHDMEVEGRGLDDSLAAYLCHMCYEKDMHPGNGDKLVHGIRYLWPDKASGLPLSVRSLLGWHRIHIHGEGGPMPKEVIACIAEWMREHDQSEEALLVELAFDCYLRTGEAFALRQSDVVISRDKGSTRAALRIGVAERGESSKTGMRQGVIVDADWLTHELANRSNTNAGAKRSGEQPLIRTSPVKFRQAWHDALSALRLEYTPPHTLRHSGPSEDLASGYRTFLQVQRRGRWSSDKSVLRYAKTHTLCEAAARSPPELISRGRVIFEARAQRPKQARE